MKKWSELRDRMVKRDPEFASRVELELGKLYEDIHAQLKHPPLPIVRGAKQQGVWLNTPADSWHRRWLEICGAEVRRGDSLHRISEIKWFDHDALGGAGTAVCGVRGDFWIPGMGSRLHVPRCSHCCDFLAIPRGKGVPVNDESLTETQQEA